VSEVLRNFFTLNLV